MKENILKLKDSHQRNSGISLISLIIVIIVIIILAAIVIYMGLATPDKAKFAKFVSSLSEIGEKL